MLCTIKKSVQKIKNTLDIDVSIKIVQQDLQENFCCSIHVLFLYHTNRSFTNCNVQKEPNRMKAVDILNGLEFYLLTKRVYLK